MADIKKMDHRVHIQGPDGSIIKERHYALHIVNGNKYYNVPPLSDKFYTEGGHQIALDQVPAIAKTHLAKAEVASAEEVKAEKVLGPAKGKSKKADQVDGEADSLI